MAPAIRRLSRDILPQRAPAESSRDGGRETALYAEGACHILQYCLLTVLTLYDMYDCMLRECVACCSTFSASST